METTLPAALCDESNVSKVIFEENSICISIGCAAFSTCENLTYISIPESVVEFESGVFGSAYGVSAGKSGLTSAGPVGGGYSIEFAWTDEIPANAFNGCSTLTEVYIPESITKIGESAFMDCNQLTSITISKNVKTIGKNAFKNCRGLEEILFYPTLMNDLESDSEVFHCTDGFYGEGVKVTIGSNVTRIPAYLFGTADSYLGVNPYQSRGVQITDIQFEENSACESIGAQAFYRCNELKIAEIPSSVRTIEKNAFGKCLDLTDIYYGGTEEDWTNIEISDGNSPLWNVTRHYTLCSEDGGDGSLLNTGVHYFYKWDAENQIAYFDSDPSENPTNLGSQVTEETNTSFLEKVDELVGTYVLVETKTRDDGMIAPDTLISILPVETKSGIVTANDGLTISIDGVEYTITERLGLVLYDAGDMVTYHLYNGELVCIRDYDPDAVNPELPDDPDPEEPDEPADEYHMVVYPYGNLTIEVSETLDLTCSLYNGGAQMAVWEQPQLSISHKEDTAPISYEGWKQHQAGSYVLTMKGVSPGTAYLTIYDTATEDVVEITVEVTPSSLKSLSIKYDDDLEKKEKTVQVNWGYSLFREDARNIENSDPISFAELVKISALLSNASYDLSDEGYLQHTLNQTNYVSNNDATCITDGTKTATCDRCGEIDTLADTGSAKGHDYADATCIEPKICKICGTTEDEASGHSYATVWSKGADGHWHDCSACGDKADKAAHDYGTDGDTCLICEYEYAHVHELTLVPSVDATCTTSGNVAYYTCSDCENWFEDSFGTSVIADKTTVIINAWGHDMAKANCLDAARCQRQNCDYTKETALGHVDENADKKCDRCSMSLETEQPGDINRPSVDNPQTGDSCSLELWITLLILSFACTIVCICCGKKRNVK